jgi:radical SAM protein with 4Fe4S-binding SPASM domain
MQSNRINLLSAIPLKTPLTIHLELTNRCNFKCKFCPESFENYEDLVGGFKFLTFNQFIYISNQILELGTIKVLRLWIMGEPLLNKELPKMIRHAKNIKISDRIEVTTNASALTKSIADELIDSGLDILKISIYGVDQKHNEITQTNTSPEKIRQNIEYFVKQNNIKKTTKVTIKLIDPINLQQVNIFKEIYHELADELVIEDPHSWTDSENFGILKNVYSLEQLKNQIHSKSKSVCSFPFYTLAIHSDGEVSVCCVDWEKKTSIGNCFNNSLSELWNSDKLYNFRKKHINRETATLPACSSCNYFIDNAPDNIDSINDLTIIR